MRNTFSKSERLCSKILIDSLFKKGYSLYYSPFLLKWRLNSTITDSSCQVLLIAPKKLFKHAVERNRRKRMLRECFRTKKHRLYTFLKENNLQICLSIAYTKTDSFTKGQLDIVFEEVFDRLIKDISNRKGIK